MHRIQRLVQQLQTSSVQLLQQRGAKASPAKLPVELLQVTTERSCHLCVCAVRTKGIERLLEATMCASRTINSDLC